jgi:hypothetical protein
VTFSSNRRGPHDTLRGHPQGPAIAETTDASVRPGSDTMPDVDGPLHPRDDRPSAHPVSRGSGTPLVEIEVTHEHGPAPRNERPRRAVEVWTQNRVYILDSTLLCIDVVDRGSDKQIAGHAFLTARLVGGQAQNGDVMELSHPFPRPGTEAVFEQVVGGHAVFSRTSSVVRVVLRFHIVTVSQTRVIPTWEEITGALKPP